MPNQMDILKWLKENRTKSHIYFWLLIIFASIVNGFGYGQDPIASLIVKLIYLPAQILGTYFFLRVLLPMIYKSNFFKCSMLFMASAYVYMVITHLNYDFGIGRLIDSWHKPHMFWSIFYDFDFFFRYLVDIYIVVFTATAFKLFKDQFGLQEQRIDIEQQRIKSQEDLLKTNVEPDFLLSNLRKIALDSEEDATSVTEHIASLSEILEYNLYTSSKPSVLLKTEVETTINYVNLARPRYGNMNYTVDLLDQSIKTISPMLLISLLKLLNRRNVGIEGLVIKELENALILQIKFVLKNSDLSIVSNEIHDYFTKNCEQAFSVNTKQQNSINLEIVYEGAPI